MNAAAPKRLLHVPGGNTGEEPVSPHRHKLDKARKESMALFCAEGNDAQGDKKDFSCAVGDLRINRHP